MPIQQHPIPQNVTAYQFRLVGDMTLFQFLQLAGGIVIGVMIYATPLPGFLKYPLAAIPVALGAGMAFLPIQGRPLDQWIVAFIRSIYQPTIYTWSRPQEPPHVSNTPPPLTNIPTPGQFLKPTTTPAVFDAGHPDTTPKIHTLVADQPGSLDLLAQTLPQPATTPQTQPDANALGRVVYTTPIKVEHSVVPPKLTGVGSSPATNSLNQLPQDSKVPTARVTSAINFSKTLPIPSTPSTPNTVVGMTLSPEGSILESTVIEIRHDNLTIRATKSNKLGQFLFAKPLDSGTYQITAEKDGVVFPVYQLPLTGQVIPPVKLQASKRL